MKIKTSFPNVAMIMEREIRAGQAALNKAIKQGTADLKRGWRGQIMEAGLGLRLSNSVRSVFRPDKRLRLDAFGVVYSSADKIIDAHDKGGVIKSKDGGWLVVPTDAAPKGAGGSRLSVAEVERRIGRLIFIYRKRGPSLLIAQARLTKKGKAAKSRSKTGRGLSSIPIFFLYPQVHLPKRLNLQSDIDKVSRSLPLDLVSTWK